MVNDGRVSTVLRSGPAAATSRGRAVVQQSGGPRPPAPPPPGVFSLKRGAKISSGILNLLQRMSN